MINTIIAIIIGSISKEKDNDNLLSFSKFNRFLNISIFLQYPH